MVLGGVTFIAGTAIASAGNQELSESVQKITLNYFQVAAMIKVFPLRYILLLIPLLLLLLILHVIVYYVQTNPSIT